MPETDQAPLPFRLARTGDPWTSHTAAAAVDRVRESQAAVLSVLRGRGPMTDEQIALALDRAGVVMSPSGARTRRKELVDQGLVVDTGRTALTRSNRHTIIWTATS